MLLQRGAAKVFAVDVGTNQLAWTLRQDPRVIVHEQTNARYLTDAVVTEPVDIIVCDASFISLAKVLDKALDFARPGGRLLALIKPQFEAERGEIGKGGVVRDPGGARRGSATRPRLAARRAAGAVEGVTPSPITGPEGNVEFLIAATEGLDPRSVSAASAAAARMTGIASKSQLRMSFLRYALFTVPAVLLLGTLSGALSGAGTAIPGSPRCTSRRSCRPAGCSAPPGPSSTSCSAWRSAMMLHARGAKQPAAGRSACSGSSSC